MIQDLSGSWCIKGTGESTLVMDSPVPLMHHDPDRSWITDPDPDHPKGTQPMITEVHWVDPKTKIFFIHGVGISTLSSLDREIFKRERVSSMLPIVLQTIKLSLVE